MKCPMFLVTEIPVSLWLIFTLGFIPPTMIFIRSSFKLELIKFYNKNLYVYNEYDQLGAVNIKKICPLVSQNA